jgi:asparagine synthase (glutamine-hydrolysing)
VCGIAGIWGQLDEPLVRAMTAKLVHRGPDAEGMYVNQHRGVLGHRRLSIMDPEGGNQPIYNEDGSAVIVGNGEIYNFPALRKQLQHRHRFRTSSDNEAILHVFEDEGANVVRHLDGMFAFAIADGDTLFLARDPIGIKPLYYGLRAQGTPNQAIYFASELKALADWTDEAGEFPPGTYYHPAQGCVSYYEVPDRAPQDLPLPIRLQRLRQTLEDAVIKRTMSDVPWGAFLSGGLDSSIIAAIVRQHVDELHTFSVGIEGSRDLEAARLAARHIGSIHHEYTLTVEEVWKELPAIIYSLESFDQDLVRSAIPTYFCSRLAAEYVKVILTGEGADELFAGYTYYRSIADPADLHRELRRSVASLHNINLQRVDRATMAHGLEGRVPFLDLALIDMAQTIPPALKLYPTGRGRRVEKWILRKACEDLLPADILWREKEQFDEGSGTVDLLEHTLQSATQGIDFQAYTARYPDDQLRSAEECFYHKLLLESFARPGVVLKNVARWAQRPPLNGHPAFPGVESDMERSGNAVSNHPRAT